MDKVTKLLLTLIALLLGGLLLRSAPSPAFAQTAMPQAANRSQPQLAVNGSDVYILQNNTLYVYEWSNDISKRLNKEINPENKPDKLGLILTRPLKNGR